MKTLHIVHVEDDEMDASMLEIILASEKIPAKIRVVSTRRDFQAALAQDELDLILSDFSMPRFDGLSALDIAQKHRPEVPFIFLSGTIGEELAVQALREGATDYVLKDRLGRLPAAIRRAIAEVEAAKQRRQLEARYLRTQRIETIGALAGGIAHDLNNSLTPVMLALSIARNEVTNDDTKRLLEIAQTSAQHSVEMVKQILSFSRGVGGSHARLGLGQLIQDAVKFAQDTFPRSIQIQSKVAPELSAVNGNATQLYQVLLNLCINARDAMPSGGGLHIEATNINLDDTTPRSQPQPPGSYVLLTASDTGHGMSAEVQAKIFEPFFTTKEIGKGTGLGLSTVMGIVKTHGGFVEVASEIGKGSLFRIFLPAFKAGAESA